jgi:DNA-binding beta-propeller fold protein YncE
MFAPVFGSALLAPEAALADPAPAIALQGSGTFVQATSTTPIVADLSQGMPTSISSSSSGLPQSTANEPDGILAPVIAAASVHGSAADSGSLVYHRQGNGNIQPDFNSGDLYVASYGNSSVLDYDVSTGMGKVVQSGGGLSAPCDMVFAPDGGLYVANQGNSSIGRIDPDTGVYTTFASGIPGATGLVLSPDGGSLFVTAQSSNSILKYDLSTGQGTTFASNVQGGNPAQLAISARGTQMYVATGTAILKYDLATGQGTALAANLSRPTGLAVAPNGSLYASLQNSNQILQVNPISGTYTVFASGNGLSSPEDLTVSPDGSTLYSANYSNSTIFKFDLSSGVQSTFASGSPMNGTYGLAFAP